MPLDQSKRQIGIDTPLGANVLVLRNFTATEELGRLFQIDAELLSENFQISFPQIVGQNVTIRLETIQAGQRFFNGHVRSFRQTGAVGRLARYHAVIVPKLWFLTRSADCRIFQNKKVPDIVKEVLQERGITDIEDTLTAGYPQWEYCVQYRETDFNFISRLMEQEGFIIISSIPWALTRSSLPTAIAATQRSLATPTCRFTRRVWECKPPGYQRMGDDAGSAGGQLRPERSRLRKAEDLAKGSSQHRPAERRGQS